MSMRGAFNDLILTHCIHGVTLFVVNMSSWHTTGACQWRSNGFFTLKSHVFLHTWIQKWEGHDQEQDYKEDLCFKGYVIRMTCLRKIPYLKSLD